MSCRPPTAEAEAQAACWYAQLADHALGRGGEAAALHLPIDAAGASPEILAAFVAHTLNQGKTLLLLVPSDEHLPALSNALDLALRPLCLVLPSADFAARIALRATLSLLRSRLARDDDDVQTPAWQAQRERLRAHDELWQAAQHWNAANDRSPWPGDVATLFPVRILPLAACAGLPPAAIDLTLAVACDPGIHGRLSGRWQLCLGAPAAQSTGDLILADETMQLRAELAQLSQDVGELELELATAQAEMAAFTQRYYSQIGRRISELDVLHAKLARSRANRVGDTPPPQFEAEVEVERLERQARQSSAEQARFEHAAAGEAAPPKFRPNDQLKRRFRELAQKIHPDRAEDETDRAWRTQLMSEANRAYRAGDAKALGEIAEMWAEGRQAPIQRAPQNDDAVRHLHNQIARLRQRFQEIKQELARLFGSKLYELFLAARHAGRYGRDLLDEMALRLDRQIADALAALNAA